jgi:S-adenosylmethionine:tRNA ribosyltransferase-isomerase
MRTSEFDFDLPAELIAQRPAAQRDQSRLLVLHRKQGRIEHRQFQELLSYLIPGDVLVLNNSRVIPARLHGVNAKTGGQFELLLLEENGLNDWWAMMRPGKRARVGTQIILGDATGRPSNVYATVVATNEEGHRRLHFASDAGLGKREQSVNILDLLDSLGEIPLPPYITREDRSLEEPDRERYQTVFAEPAGSVAAPTAGLHFTKPLLDKIRSLGAEVCFVTLHVGLGTFAPVKAENISGHTMHEERYELSQETARKINDAKASVRRVMAVGTTSVRVLESATEPSGAHGGGHRVKAGKGKTRIFIHPPYEFKIVDALLTNFHLPRSTLLMLVSAFAAPNQLEGRELIPSAYSEAVRQRYRFFSYGDAMLLV